MLIFVMHVRIDLHECVFADVDRCLITVVIRTHRGYYMRLYFQIFGDALFLHLSLSCQMLTLCHHAMFFTFTHRQRILRSKSNKLSLLVSMDTTCM